jgi:outer membrane protein OmpA-like peptidoglycan-associated protein
MRLEGRSDINDALGLTSGQALILQSERLTRIVLDKSRTRTQPVAQSSGAGFKVDSSVKFYLLPDTYLGSIATDSLGAYNGRVNIPAGIAEGVHTLQANGFAPDGSVRSLSIGVLVRPTATPVRAVQAKTAVYFKALSSQLSAEAKSSLKSLVRATHGRGITSVVIGFVQPTQVATNDESLSTTRARTVARYLRTCGLKGALVVRGDGVASQTGANARRVDVKVTYAK